MLTVVWFVGGVGVGCALCSFGHWLDVRRQRRARQSPALVFKATSKEFYGDARWDFTDHGDN
jgi:hypothetical protein